MGIKLADAIVFFRGDRSGLDKDLRQSEKDTRRWASRVGGIAKQAIGFFVGQVAFGAARAVANIGKEAIQSAMELEGIREGFQGIAGDADAMLQALREGTLGTVKDAELMRQYNQAAQLVGTTFADQLPEAMTYLRKIAASTGEDMGFMIDSLVRGVGRLSPAILDNLQIQVTLADATARAAEMFGVEESALTKAQVQAGMTAEVLDKLRENTAAMPDVTNNAATKVAQLKTKWANFKDEIGLKVLPILVSLGGQLLPIAERYLPKLVDWVGRGIQAFGRTVGIVKELVGLFFSWRGKLTLVYSALKKLLGPQAAALLISHLRQAAQWLQDNLLPALQEFVNRKEVIVVVLGAIATGFTLWAKAALAAKIETLAALAPVIAAIAAIGAAVYLFYEAWTNNWGGIQEKVQAVWDAVRPIFEAIGRVLHQVWTGTIQPTLKALYDKISEWWNTIAPRLQVAWEWIWNKAVEIFNAIRGFIEEHMATIRTIIENVWNAIYSIIEMVWGIISGFISTVLAVFQGDWAAAWESVKGIFESIWNGIKNFLASIWGAIKNLAILAWNAVKDKIKEILDSISGWFKKIWNGIVSWLSGLWGSFKDAGKRLMDAIWEGLKEIWEKVKEWAVNAANWLWETFATIGGGGIAAAAGAAAGEEPPSGLVGGEGSGGSTGGWGSVQDSGGGGGDTTNYNYSPTYNISGNAGPADVGEIQRQDVANQKAFRGR